MPDMLVKLYDLPPYETTEQFQARTGVSIRRAKAPEKHIVAEWVRSTFNPHWMSECEVAFSRNPITCLVAVENEKLLGFACYDATVKGFFGPTGVDEQERGRGIGTMLLFEALRMMYSEGHAYAIIGGAGPVDFYEKTVGAQVIDGSVPGIYKGMLK